MRLTYIYAQFQALAQMAFSFLVWMQKWKSSKPRVLLKLSFYVRNFILKSYCHFTITYLPKKAAVNNCAWRKMKSRQASSIQLAVGILA